MNITHQRAAAILKRMDTTVKEFKRSTFCGYAEMCLPRGGKIKHHKDKGYWLHSYSKGDCVV